jgi:hypothetical protein
LSTRRLRALTVDDPLNPGWRTIRLHGGGPWHRISTQVQDDDGVEAALLLPSPPILYVSDPGADPPPIPFHLHFHSTQWLPLSTFSDPRESDYVVRLTRVTTMRIGVDRIRRMEIPSKVDLWQEGEPRVTLGEERHLGGVSHQGEHRAPAAASSSSGVSREMGGNSSPTTNKPRRRSFFHRRSSDAQKAPQMQRSASAVAATPESAVVNTTTPPPALVGPALAAEPSPFAPLAAGSTDVHLLGQLTIETRYGGNEIVRDMVQSFQTPELSVSYGLEISIWPRNSTVKEAFKHVWGAGLIEVVVGLREEG